MQQALRVLEQHDRGHQHKGHHGGHALAPFPKRAYANQQAGQQQRCAIGRALVKNPGLLLCDEPTGALDYKTSKEILALMEQVNRDYGCTIVIVTHNMQQAARIADYTAFFNLKAVGQPGHLEYFTDTTTMFNNPQNEEAERYVSGRFG